MDIWLQNDIAPEFGPLGRYRTKKAQIQSSQGHIWGAEISTTSENFLDILIRNKISDKFLIHRFPVYDLDMAPCPLPYCVQCIVTFLICIINKRQYFLSFSLVNCCHSWSLLTMTYDVLICQARSDKNISRTKISIDWSKFSIFRNKRHF